MKDAKKGDWSRNQFGRVAEVMPNGNIRFHLDDRKKTAISEMQIVHPRNIANTIISVGGAKIIEINDDGQVDTHR